MDHLQETTHCESYGHVTNDVMTPKYEAQYLGNCARYRVGVNGAQIGINHTLRVLW